MKSNPLNTSNSLTRRIIWYTFDVGILAFAIPCWFTWFTLKFAPQFFPLIAILFPAIAMVEDVIAKAVMTPEEYAEVRNEV